MRRSRARLLWIRWREVRFLMMSQIAVVKTKVYYLTGNLFGRSLLWENVEYGIQTSTVSWNAYVEIFCHCYWVFSTVFRVPRLLFEVLLATMDWFVVRSFKFLVAKPLLERTRVLGLAQTVLLQWHSTFLAANHVVSSAASGGYGMPRPFSFELAVRIVCCEPWRFLSLNFFDAM